MMDTSNLSAIKSQYGIVGNCDALNSALDIAMQVARTDLSVLIVGESGVGKEVLPRIIHNNSARARGNYLAINCGSIPEGTIDSELFGHEKGSFTGAIGEREGYFGAADGGTLFLDEVGELPLSTQARLLRVLETGEYIRVGGTEPRKTNVRIIAATNVNMVRAITEGRFRSDLYYRLNTIPLRMPALRERGRDVLLLFRFFALKMAETYKTPLITLSEGSERLMLKYKWPGNIRQLKNITEQLAIMSPKRVIEPDFLLTVIPEDEESMMLATTGRGTSAGSDNGELLQLRQAVQAMGMMMTDLQQRIDNLYEILGVDKGQAGGGGLLPSPPHLIPDFTPGIEVAPSVHDMSGIGEESEYVEVSHTPETLNLRDMSSSAIEKALEQFGGNRKKAAEALGVSERTIYRELKKKREKEGNAND